MIVSDLDAVMLRRRLRGRGLVVRTGPFHFRLQSEVDAVADGLSLLYADHSVASEDAFADFSVTITRRGGLRRLVRPQIDFLYDGERPFVPLPVDHAFPLLEWAMNWCISTQSHHGLTLHAAVIERDGHAVVMPAPPGSGKSTLCAGLVSRGWRLLSDELALVSLVDSSLTPLCRPISLKNESLAVIRAFVPDAVLNRVTHDTAKGSVSHMKVPSEHLRRVDETATPRWVVFPRYQQGSGPVLRARSKAEGLLELGRNSFNYSVLGCAGYDALARLVSMSDCLDFTYSRLDDAVAAFDRLAERASAEAAS